MIVTGAPLDFVEYEDVTYWNQICELMEWSKTCVKSTLWVCWGAFATLYHRYGINKHPINSKLSGVFNHMILHQEHPLMHDMHGVIRVPHSRHVVVSTAEILAQPNLEILAYSPEAGAYLVAERDSNDIMMFGHPEYNALTLHNEYVRDLRKASIPIFLTIIIPTTTLSYCPKPVERTRCHIILQLDYSPCSSSTGVNACHSLSADGAEAVRSMSCFDTGWMKLIR